MTNAPDLSTLLLLSNAGGWATRVVVTADCATVSTGMGSVIPVAADEDHAGPVVEVVGAIINGDAEEYFGTGDYGPLSVIGHRVWYPGGERRALDAGAVVAATYRAIPWT